MPLRRARALNAVLERCYLLLTPGELLVGSGTARFTREGDEAALAQARELLAEVGGRSFTTHADHLAPDYPTLLAEGLGGLLARAQAALDRHPVERGAFLSATVEAVRGLQAHLLRWAEETARAARLGRPYAELLSAQSVMLRSLVTEPPSSLWGALQLLLLTHCALQLDGRYAMALGRLDQTLLPYYQADLAAGRLSQDDAQALVDHLFAKLAHEGDIQNVCVGGVDAHGRDATNALSYCCVAAVRRLRQPGANLTARVHPGTPDDFLRLCAECIRTGVGFPALYNDEVQIPALLEQGYPLADARDYCFVGCIETFIPGRQAPWADSRFNLLRCVDLALRGGVDALTGLRLGPATGVPGSWEELWSAFLARMRSGIAAHVEELNRLKREADDRGEELASPLLSALVRDCLDRGRDLCDGGARYPGNHGIAGMGIGSTADALAALKRLVFEDKRVSLDELLRWLDAEFQGFERERQLLLSGAPKYGNDDPEVDSLASEVCRAFGEEVLRHRTPSGGRYWGLLAANVQNVSAGKEVGATPDGRRAREPLSDAASPTFGRDLRGPTAVLQSVASLDYRLVPGGNVVNLKLHPTCLAGREGIDAFVSLLRAYFSLGGVQLQVNAAGRALLEAAMADPASHQGLVVRVSGFSAFFTRLDPDVQKDILARTEHSLAPP
jgi:formate C-acetyltransferase